MITPAVEGLRLPDIQIISEMYEEDLQSLQNERTSSCIKGSGYWLPQRGVARRATLHTHCRLNAALAYRHSKKQLCNHISLDAGLGK
jgi:hypothetical protein